MLELQTTSDGPLQTDKSVGDQPSQDLGREGVGLRGGVGLT